MKKMIEGSTLFIFVAFIFFITSYDTVQTMENEESNNKVNEIVINEK